MSQLDQGIRHFACFKTEHFEDFNSDRTVRSRLRSGSNNLHDISSLRHQRTAHCPMNERVQYESIDRKPWQRLEFLPDRLINFL
jgi:hypothetical protein